MYAVGQRMREEQSVGQGYHCSGCGGTIGYGQRDCPWCGRGVVWLSPVQQQRTPPAGSGIHLPAVFMGVFVIVLLVLLAPAAVNSLLNDSTPISAGPAKSRSHPITDAHHGPRVTPAAPRGVSPSPVSNPTDGLTDYGATVAVWDAHHVEDRRYALGAAYDPDPSLAVPNDPQHDDRYYAVDPLYGRVLVYEMRVPGEPVSMAQVDALRELPPDARRLWFATKGSCAQLAMQSRTLATVMANPGIGDREGIVVIEFGTDFATYEGYDPSRVTVEMFAPWDAPTPSSGPGC